MRKIGWIMTSLALCFGGCGGGEAVEEQEQVVESTGGELATVEAPVSWNEMDRDQRLAYMQSTVNPEMQAMFQEFDGERFADFGCASCHGANMQDVDFAMPNGVAPLDPTAIPAMFGSEEPMLVFMTQQVWPRMGELLGREMYSEENTSGFSCLNCHAMAEPSGE